MKKLVYLSVITAACWTFQACNSGKTTDSVDAAQDSNENSEATAVKDDDSEFMVMAANGGMTEVEAGKLAEEKAQSASLKEYGSMMVKDHTTAGDELKMLAATKNVALPSSIGEDEREHLNEMAELSGKDFDEHYVKMMVEDHEKTVKMFEDAAENAKDADVRGWAAKTLPALREHEKAIKAIKDKM